MALRISFRLLLLSSLPSFSILPRALLHVALFLLGAPAKFSNLVLKIYVTWGPLVCGTILSWGPDKI